MKNPISLRDIKVKVDDSDYETTQEFVDDMARLFDNGDLYNKVSVFHKTFLLTQGALAPRVLYDA